jgi:hypothetical protein
MRKNTRGNLMHFFCMYKKWKPGDYFSKYKTRYCEDCRKQQAWDGHHTFNFMCRNHEQPNFFNRLLCCLGIHSGPWGSRVDRHGSFFWQYCRRCGRQWFSFDNKKWSRKRYEDMYTSHDDTGDGSIKKRARGQAACGQCKQAGLNEVHPATNCHDDRGEESV